MEKTVILIKPDAIQRELAGEIITKIERKGLKIVGIKMMQLTDEILKVHYSHLAHKPFFSEITDFMKSTPIICICAEGIDAVETVRRLTGVTLSREAKPGTIRGELAMGVQSNLVHTSDTVENAKTEIDRFFNENEIFQYSKLLDQVIYAKKELNN